jgi:hypothetical protein
MSDRTRNLLRRLVLLVLLLTCSLKLIAIASGTAFLQATDLVLTTKNIYILEAAVLAETALIMLGLFRVDYAFYIGLLLFSLVGALYRVFRLLMNAPSDCPCLGNLDAALPVPRGLINAVVGCALVLFFVSSVQWLGGRRSQCRVGAVAK